MQSRTSIISSLMRSPNPHDEVLNYSLIALLVLSNLHLIGIAYYSNLIWSTCTLVEFVFANS